MRKEGKEGGQGRERDWFIWVPSISSKSKEPKGTYS